MNIKYNIETGGDEMNIDLNRLINNFIDKIEVDEIISFDDTHIKNTDIRKLEDVVVKGTISKSESDIYYLNLLVAGTMILPCAITLEDTEYPFSIEISEIFSDIEEKEERYFKINGNSIDIMSIIWQNIVLDINCGLKKGDSVIVEALIMSGHPTHAPIQRIIRLRTTILKPIIEIIKQEEQFGIRNKEFWNDWENRVKQSQTILKRRTNGRK